MHSDTTEKSGSPRKRIVSRALSEEESLRHIIQEAEETPKRLSRRDSRCGSFRRGDTRESQSENEPAENTAEVELQQDYEACLAELQSVERHQGVLMFQLDCLQDALEGAEEVLAETQRENKQISMELEREREQRRKLELMVETLKQEVERLKEERNSVRSEHAVKNKMEDIGAKDSPAVAQTHVKSVHVGPESAVSQPTEPDGSPVGPSAGSTAASPVGPSAGSPVGPSAGSTAGSPVGPSAGSPVGPSAGSTAGSPVGPSAASTPGSPVGPAALFAAGGVLVSFFKNRKSDQNQSKPVELKPVDQTVDQDRTDSATMEESSGKAPDAEDNDESSGYEDAPADFSPGSSTPDGLPYPDMPEDELRELRSSSGDGNNPEACVLS